MSNRVKVVCAGVDVKGVFAGVAVKRVVACVDLEGVVAHVLCCSQAVWRDNGTLMVCLRQIEVPIVVKSLDLWPVKSPNSTYSGKPAGDGWSFS